VPPPPDSRNRAPIALAGAPLLAGLLLSLLVGARAGGLDAPSPPLAAMISTLGIPGDEPTPARVDESVTMGPQAAPNPGRADQGFVRWYRAPLAGGLLLFPPSFASADGRYDLVIHFNGNTDLVEESYGHAGVNAVVMILNLGVGSGLYEDRFADPAAFSLILDRVQSVMEQRGLRNPRLGRIAVSAWSSGYGGVIKLLQQPSIADRIDAVVLFDAIHCGIDAYTKQLKADQIEPIRAYARRAAEGRVLLAITHSEIETYGYLNAGKTTDVVLQTVGVSRTRTSAGQPMPDLKSMVGVLPKALMLPLPPRSEAHRGGLHVRGYGGNGPVTHMLHLVQMSKTALPFLVERWKE
jgi:hypothetical protein